MKRIFKTGEKVQLKEGSQAMHILRYICINGIISSLCVECWWYDDKWGYLTSIFHQDEVLPFSSKKNVRAVTKKREYKYRLSKPYRSNLSRKKIKV